MKWILRQGLNTLKHAQLPSGMGKKGKGNAH
jgi:hypothetical protein